MDNFTGDSLEETEALLCAYIEGDLDAEGQARIEKRLADNPQYRGLLAELAAARKSLRDLPRSVAPPELIDALQGQMERSALLDENPLRPQAAMRINRWPQIMAIAAVVFLTLGLGMVIYSILPKQNKTDQPNYASNVNGSDLLKIPASQPEQPLAMSQPRDAAAVKGDNGGGMSIDGGSVLPATQPRDALVDNRPEANGADLRREQAALREHEDAGAGGMSNAAGPAGGGAPMFKAGATLPSAPALVAQADKAKEPADQKSLQLASASNTWVMVDTSNVSDASTEIARYLQDNNIAYQSVDQQTARKLNLLSSALEENNRTAEQQQFANTEDTHGKSEVMQNANQGQAQQSPARLAQAPGQAQQRAGTAGQQQISQATNKDLNANLSQAQTRFDEPSKADQQNFRTASAPAHYFIARMDHRQAAELTEYMRRSTQVRTQSVAVLTPPAEGAYAPAAAQIVPRTVTNVGPMQLPLPIQNQQRQAEDAARNQQPSQATQPAHDEAAKAATSPVTGEQQPATQPAANDAIDASGDVVIAIIDRTPMPAATTAAPATSPDPAAPASPDR